LAITEGWLKQKGAIPICGGDWTKVYSLANHFFEVDTTFGLVNRILHHTDQTNWRYLYRLIIGPHHLRCHQPMFPMAVAQGSPAVWGCETCQQAIALEVVGGAA